MWFTYFLPPKVRLRSWDCDFGFIWEVSTNIPRSSDLMFPLLVLDWVIVNSAPIERETYQTKRQGTGTGTFLQSCSLVAGLLWCMLGGCWLGLADHSSTERVNRCSVAFPNRGDLTCSNLALCLGSCWQSRRKRGGQGKRERGVCRERRGEEGWKIKRDKQRRVGVWGGRRVVPQRDHSWCLTPLVLLMCDAQEIDRLCKTQPTGENNNTSQTHETGNSAGLWWEETAVGVGWTAALVDVTFTHSGKVSWAHELIFRPPPPSRFTLTQ